MNTSNNFLHATLPYRDQPQELNMQDASHQFFESPVGTIQLKQVLEDQLIYKVSKFVHKENKLSDFNNIIKDKFVYINWNLYANQIKHQTLKLSFKIFISHNKYQIRNLLLIQNKRIGITFRIQSRSKYHPLFQGTIIGNLPDISLFQIVNQQIIPIRITQIQERIPKLKKSQASSTLKLIYVDYDSEIIPEGPEEETSQNLLKSEIFQMIQKLFQNRPIWIRNSLMFTLLKQQNAQEVNMNLVKKCLKQIAYFVKDGPWKHTYIRFGYNPKQDYTAAMYQTFEIAKSENKTYLKPESVYDPTLTSKAENFRNRYQFCDIKDKEIMTQVAKGIQQHKECDKKFGWFSMANYKEIIRLAKVKQYQL